MRKCVHEPGVGDGRDRINPDTLCNQVVTGGQENATALISQDIFGLAIERLDLLVGNSFGGIR